MCDLTNPIFTDEDKAREFLEAQRWPEGPVCPKCGEKERIRKLPPQTRKPSKKTPNPKPQKGWYHCNPCRKRFTVRVGTLYERSHIPLHKWLFATHLLCSSKKGMSAHQLHRMLGITYKSAWFMCHRIREGMRETDPAPMGGGGQVVEADETWFGKVSKGKTKWTFVNGKGWVACGNYGAQSMKVISLVERGGRARSVHVPALTANAAKDVLRRNVLRNDTHLMTDESNIYKDVGREFVSHESVNHSIKEYGRGLVHTNTIEGFFSIFKRGMKGVYQHCGEQHLHRYLAEFDFRYSHRAIDDKDRALRAVKGIEGKRLMYKGAGEAANS